MKKGIPVKQHGAARIPSPLPLSSKSNHENFHIVKDEARILRDATECSKSSVKKQISFEQSEPHTSCFFDISKVWAVMLLKVFTKKLVRFGLN